VELERVNPSAPLDSLNSLIINIQQQNNQNNFLKTNVIEINKCKLTNIVISDGFKMLGQGPESYNFLTYSYKFLTQGMNAQNFLKMEDFQSKFSILFL